MSSGEALKKIWVSKDFIAYPFSFDGGTSYIREDLVPKQDDTTRDKLAAIVIVRRHLDSITEARKDTPGLGVAQHVLKMILAEIGDI